MSNPHNALKAAIALVGTQADFARLIGRTRARITQMLNKGDGLPVQHVLTVERATGIPRTLLRPDIYPPQETN